MFIIEGLTDNGWSFEARHDSRDNAFWHARAKSDATGRTFRPDQPGPADGLPVDIKRLRLLGNGIGVGRLSRSTPDK